MYRFPLPNKIMMKKYARKVLAATMAVSMMVKPSSKTTKENDYDK